MDPGKKLFPNTVMVWLLKKAWEVLRKCEIWDIWERNYFDCIRVLMTKYITNTYIIKVKLSLSGQLVFALVNLPDGPKPTIFCHHHHFYFFFVTTTTFFFIFIVLKVAVSLGPCDIYYYFFFLPFFFFSILSELLFRLNTLYNHLSPP